MPETPVCTDNEKKVALQISVQRKTRVALKLKAIEHDTDMGRLGEILLEHGIAQLSSAKPPKELIAALKTVDGLVDEK